MLEPCSCMDLVDESIQRSCMKKLKQKGKNKCTIRAIWLIWMALFTKENHEFLQEKLLFMNCRRVEIPYLFVTNNTTRTPETVRDMLATHFNIETPVSTIYTATLATIDCMNDQNLGKRSMWSAKRGSKMPSKKLVMSWMKKHLIIVVIGLDWKSTMRSLLLRPWRFKRERTLSGLTPDLNIPTERGLLPGAGSLIALVEAATRVEPVIIGKLKSIIMDKAIEHLGLAREEMVMIWRQLPNRYSWGIDNGIPTFWWLQVLPNQKKCQPTNRTDTCCCQSRGVGFWCLKVWNQLTYFLYLVSCNLFLPLLSLGPLIPWKFIGWGFKAGLVIRLLPSWRILMSWWTTWPILFQWVLKMPQFPLQKMDCTILRPVRYLFHLVTVVFCGHTSWFIQFMRTVVKKGLPYLVP